MREREREEEDERETEQTDRQTERHIWMQRNIETVTETVRLIRKER
jgi:hypothetical protein